MVATYDAQSLRARSERKLLDFDPDAGTEVAVRLNPSGAKDYVSIANFRRFIAGLMRSVGAGSVTTFKIYAAESDTGTNAAAVVAHAIGSAPDAVGDTIWLECDVEQIHEVLPTATHVGVKITLVTSTDECVVLFERAEPRFPAANLTADYVS